MADDVKRGAGGRFLPGTKPGPGRPANAPRTVEKVITDGVLEEMLESLLETAREALTEDGEPDKGRRERARDQVLRHRCPAPPPWTPDIPPIAWPKVMGASDLGAAVGAMLQAHSDGKIDGSGLDFLCGVMAKLAKILEVADLKPEVDELREYVEQLRGAA